MTEDLKRSLLTEIGNWKMAYGKAMNNKASLDMRNLLETIDDTQKKLSRPCKDLDDIRSHMNSLNQIKEKEIEIDRTITPIEETYAMLNKYEITFNDGNAEKVDSLAYGWKNLNEKAREVQDDLIRIQPTFKTDLLSKVAQFKIDSTNYVDEYNGKGPMVEGNCSFLFHKDKITKIDNEQTFPPKNVGFGPKHKNPKKPSPQTKPKNYGFYLINLFNKLIQ